jgi:hypothetical protein
MERNKFLTEAMGYIYYSALCGYNHPDLPYLEFMESSKGINFSSWEGFGKLWTWVQKQDWFSQFVCWEWSRGLMIGLGYSEEVSEGLKDWAVLRIHPDNFADTVYKYLKERTGGA